MSDPAAIRTTVAAYLDRLSALDREGWLGLWAEDATMEDPVGSPVRHGRSEIAGFFDEFSAMVDGIEARPAGPVVVLGNEAAFLFEIRPKLGDTVMSLLAYDVMTFDDADARITSQRAFVDMSTMAPADD